MLEALRAAGRAGATTTQLAEATGLNRGRAHEALLALIKAGEVRVGGQGEKPAGRGQGARPLRGHGPFSRCHSPGRSPGAPAPACPPAPEGPRSALPAGGGAALGVPPHAAGGWTTASSCWSSASSCASCWSCCRRRTCGSSRGPGSSPPGGCGARFLDGLRHRGARGGTRGTRPSTRRSWAAQGGAGAGGRCCGARGAAAPSPAARPRAVDVHHAEGYARLGRERLEELLGVCERHHRQLHGRSER